MEFYKEFGFSTFCVANFVLKLVVKIKLDLEKTLLIGFFTVFLFLGPGVLFGHIIKHDFPYGYFASDTFQHQIRAEAIKDAGNFRYEATYVSKGFEKVVGRYPPILYHLAVLLSYPAGIETYDSIYFIVAFLTLVASFVMYILIKDFNRNAALISLPLSLLIFSSPPAIGFLWGHWPSLLSQSFLILLFWSILRMDLEKSYIFIALSLSATVLTHTSETIFGFIFLALFFGIKLLRKNIKFKDIKIMFIAAFFFLILSSYYLIIFFNTWAKAQPYSFFVQSLWEGNPGFYIAGFGLLLIPMLIGMIFSLIKIKEMHISIIAAFAMLFNGFLNYAGFEVRSFQIRFFWPIYLSVFFGLGIYIAFKSIIKKWNFFYSIAIFLILIISLSGFVKFPILNQTKIQIIPYIPYLNRDSNQGIMDNLHWEALTWLSKNTEKDAKIYFFYGDIYSQDALLRNSKRVHYQVDPEGFIKVLKERKIMRNYTTEMPGDSGGSIAARKSFFKFEDATKDTPQKEFFGYHDICKFNYLVFDKGSAQQVLAQYNLLIAQDMIKKNFIKPVFDNQGIVILKNEKPGEDCIEERIF